MLSQLVELKFEIEKDATACYAIDVTPIQPAIARVSDKQYYQKLDVQFSGS